MPEARPADTHVENPMALGAYPLRLSDCLVAGARKHPQRTLVAARGADGNWQHLSYGQAFDSARRIGQALRRLGLSAERPLAILAGNGLAHCQLAMGALYAGIPYAPLAGAGSGRLAAMLDLLTPGAILLDAHAVPPTALPAACTRLEMASLLATDPADIDAANAAIDGDSIAKFLFTSGSTAPDGASANKAPKAVITTQRMLCSNQQMLLQALPMLGAAPPVLVDWLPWHHTYGGSHNFGIVLYNGGTLYIDAGKPAPGAFDTTLGNLREIAPTAHFNVPRGWDLLARALEQDAALRRHFFQRVQLLFCAGAPMSAALWQRLHALARQEGRTDLAIVSGLGMTETAPACLFGSGAVPDPLYVGMPASGCRLKLVASQGKREAWYAGPHVSPGYWRDPVRTRAAFDADGYLRSGDALRLADPAQPQLGFLFDGRLADDFKLDSGTWVGTAALRARVLAHGAPCVADVVLAGSGRAQVAALVFAQLDACRALARLEPHASIDAVLASAPLRAHFSAMLERVNHGKHGSAARIGRLLVMQDRPAQCELTDKGALSVAAVLHRRAALVEALYAGSLAGAYLDAGA